MGWLPRRLWRNHFWRVRLLSRSSVHVGTCTDVPQRWAFFSPPPGDTTLECVTRSTHQPDRVTSSREVRRVAHSALILPFLPLSLFFAVAECLPLPPQRSRLRSGGSSSSAPLVPSRSVLLPHHPPPRPPSLLKSSFNADGSSSPLFEPEKRSPPKSRQLSATCLSGRVPRPRRRRWSSKRSLSQPTTRPSSALCSSWLRCGE
jgi:hypothetical protein